jgi:GNAT superfamily N-acetyltransferase
MELNDVTSPYLEETLVLYKRVFPETYEIDIDGVKEFLLRGVYRIFISIQSSRVAAGAIISAIPNHPEICHLDYIFVNKDMQGKGIGSKFITDLISHLKSQNRYKTMTLECYDELVGFYKRFGAYTSIQPSQMGSYKKLYNFLAISIHENHILNANELKSVLFAVRGLHGEELDQSDPEKYIWKIEFATQCK